MTDPTALFLLLVSPAIGSFLAVLVDRLPRGENVVSRRSFCRSCGTQLHIGDLVPILSFAWSKGRCRRCDSRIPPWVLYLEIAAIAAAGFAIIASDTAATMLITAVFLWLLLGLAVSDLLWMRLPDLLTALLFASGLIAAMGSDGSGVEMALLGAALGAGSFLVLRIIYRALRGREGLGLGDVKLMAGLGAFTGPFDLPLLVLGGAIFGILWGAIRHRRGDTLGQQSIPFGTALCLAAALLWLSRVTGLLN
ncbi:A24 family peptidase [uncultured Shimia sp.]|uniref:prepilin peptidase n=1 Tax=uncultured Shimia sp. TaxID=573152 RepID=UPI0025FAD498|nr:A24 family peptidase [uncultured Shimia sp.]